MNHIYIPTSSPDDWRRFLAEPERQWRAGYSAKELAERWEGSAGFPPELQELLSCSSCAPLQQLELLLALPEYPVDLPGGRRPSQNDLFVLARVGDGQLAAVMVEGKCKESFGPWLADWLSGASDGKRERLQFLCATLGLPEALPPHIRYQLLHRAASAVITARQFNAAYALMIVHSFSREHCRLADYQEFLRLYGTAGGPGQLVELGGVGQTRLFAGWATGPLSGS